MTDLIKTKTPLLSDRTERAREAVNVFRTMQPTLTAYAQALTGNKSVRVVMAAQNNGATDGNKIIMRPPIELGDKTQHDRRLCGRRNAMFKQMCPACAVREKVLSTIYHEIGHIAFGTFEEVDDNARQEAILAAIKQSGPERTEAIKKRILNADSATMRSHIGLAGLVNEFLPTLVNVLEDARVDLSMFDARRGTRKMFLADALETFENGVEQKNAEGEVVYIKWSTYAMNAQVMVGVYCRLMGYDYSTWFHFDVVEALGDEKLSLLLDQFSPSFKAADTFYLAIAVMDRLRELGFLSTAQDPLPPQPDPEPDPEQEPEPDESDESTDDTGETSDEASQEDSPENDDSGGESGDVPPEGGADESDDNVSTDEGSSPGQSDEGDSSDNEDASSEDRDTEEGTGGTGGDVGEQDDDSNDAQGGDDGDESAEDAGLRGSGDISEQDSSGSQPEGDSDSGANSGDPDAEVDGDESDSGEVEVPTDSGTDESAGLAGDSDDEDDESFSDESGTGDESEGSGEMDSSGDVDFGPLGEGTPGTERAGSDGEGSEAQDEAGDDEELVDTGADDGYGGTRIEGEESKPERPEMGDPDEKLRMEVLKWGDHDDKPTSVQTEADEAAVDTAIIQGIYFTTPSRNVVGVREHTYSNHYIEKGHDFAEGWTHDYWGRYAGSGGGSDIEIDESIISGSLGELRVVFSANKRAKHTRNRKSGRVDGRVLGKRAPIEDPRMFKKKVEPNKRDYAVLLGGDISGSTYGHNIAIQKKAMFAQAELLHRLGVKFAVFCHSGDDSLIGDGVSMDIYCIKDFEEPWDAKAREALANIGPHSVNLDGHTLEYYRKKLDRRLETDRILMYYTDGKMPAENEQEELVILKREIAVCNQKGYHLMGVGIRTDSPKAHGLDTVQINSVDETYKVIQHLKRRLMS